MTNVGNCDYQTRSPAEPDSCQDSDGVSVVIFEDVKHQQHAISRIRSQFRSVNLTVEFVIISESGIKLTPLTDHRQLKFAKNLDGAVRCAKYDQIAIFDSNFLFSIAHWNLVQSNSTSESFHTWSYRATKPPRSKRILVGIFLIVAHWLLRVKKTRLSPGFISFRRESLDGINLAQLDHARPDAGTQLLAIARSRGKTVKEHTSSERQASVEWTRQNAADPHYPRSKSLKQSICSNLQFWFCQLAFPQKEHSHPGKVGKSRNRAFGRIGLLLLTAMILLLNSSFPLFEPDEARNAQLAINILETGDWISLSLNGQPYWDKPPLLAWMTALSYKATGISEFSTRLPTIISSILLMIVVLLTGKKLFGYRSTLYGCIALLLAWGFSFQARYVTMDAMLTLFTTTAILGTAVGLGAHKNGSRSRTWLLVSGIAMGLGILTKGPISIVIAIPPLLCWMFLTGQTSKRQFRSVLKYVFVPAMAIALPWFAIMSFKHPEYAWQFIWKHHFIRFTDAFNHEEPFWFYGPVLWLFMFPASILLPCAIRFVFSKKEIFTSRRTTQHGLLAIATVWTIGFFSLSECKLPAYILPAFPMIALLIGAAVDAEFSRDIQWRTRFDKLPKRIGIGVSIVILVAIACGRFFSESEFNFGWQSLAIFAILGLALPACIVKSKKSRQLSWAAASIIAFVFVSHGVNVLVPEIAQSRYILGGLAKMERQSTLQPIIYFGRDAHASSMYLEKGSIAWIEEDDFETLLQRLEGNSAITLVTSEEHLNRIRSVLPEILIESQQPRHTFRATLATQRISKLNSSSRR